MTQLQSGRKINTNEFLSSFNISYRTLKNDIFELNDQLGQLMISIDHNTVQVLEHDKFVEKSTDMMKTINFYHYKMSIKERIAIESIILLFSPSYVTGNDLSSQLFISRGTAINDMDLLREEMKELNLELCSKRNHGFTIIGDEKDVRAYLNSVVNEVDSQASATYKILLDQLIVGDIDADLVSKGIIRSLEQESITLNDQSFRKILNYILTAFNRILQGNHLRYDNIGAVEQGNRGLLENLAQHYFDKSEITDSELEGFNRHIENILHEQGSPAGIDSETNEQIKISAFVWEVCNSLDILEQFGYENYKSLYSHIESTIYHLKTNLTIQINPFYDELEELYPHIFDCIEKYIYIIEEIINKKMDRNDISYIAMHIASVTEAKDEENEPLHAIMVCPTGRCVSLLLKARVVKYFNVVIDDIVPAYMVNEKFDGDFIISTVPLENASCPVIVVSQLFLQADVKKMQEFIQKTYKIAKQKVIIKKIERYVKEYQLISSSDISAIDPEIEALNERCLMNSHDQEKQYFYTMLKNEHILLDLETNDWIQAIRASGELLLQTGHLKSQYIDKMIQLVQENGPYIVFAPGFAVAHAGPQDGAYRLGISLVRLKDFIQFEPGGIKVKFIVCLSIPDKASHAFLMFQMYKCLINREIFDFLSKAISVEEIRSIIRIFELAGDESE
jgi:Transcriptional antiterminator